MAGMRTSRSYVQRMTDQASPGSPTGKPNQVVEIGSLADCPRCGKRLYHPGPGPAFVTCPDHVAVDPPP